MTLAKQGTLIVIFAIVTFIAHFWHYQNLGLYEDDYFLISQPMSMNFEEFWDFFKWHILNFSVTEGRPLLYVIEFSIGLIGQLVGHFQSLYLINYLIVVIDNILFYIFLRSVWNQPVFVVAGTLAFTLFPADTNHAYLTNICLYASIALLLLAFLSYVHNQRILAYLLIFASLFCYETVFPLFLVAPFLKNEWNKSLFKQALKNTLVLAAMLAIVFIARKLTGEARISGLDMLTLILTPIRQMAIGPLVSLGMFLYRPVGTLLNLQGELLIFVPVAFISFILLFSNLARELDRVDSQDNNHHDSDILSPLKKLTLLGLILLVLSYPLFFTVPATAMNGRASRVHMTAAIGSAILVGLCCYLATNLAKNNHLSKNIINVSLAIFFSLLLGFGLTIQQENELTWQYQQAFWTDVIHLCPDIQPETIILVDAPLNTGKQLHSFIQWGVPMTLRHIYQFPKSWQHLDRLPTTDDQPRWYYWRKYTLYPKVYRLKSNWQETIVKQDKFNFDPRNKAFEYFLQWEPSRLIDSQEIILLQEKNGHLIRRSEPLKINDRLFKFKPIMPSTVQAFKKGVLYDDLIHQARQIPVNYFSL